VTPDALLDGIVHGSAAVQRRAMAKAITLLESTRADHRAQGDALLTQLLPHTRARRSGWASAACRAWANRLSSRRWGCT
jgi:putative protein kinase ArgK-like GTPase of G3E family